MKRVMNLKDLYDVVVNIRDFVLKRCSHYEQRLKWHDEDIEEIKSNITTINRLITILFLENIAIILMLIIWSW